MSDPRALVGAIRARPIRIALLVHNFDSVGGMERQAAAVAGRFRARGHEVLVVTTRLQEGLSPRPARPLLERTALGPLVRVPSFASWWPLASTHRLYEVVIAWSLLRWCADVVYAVESQAGLHAVAVAPFVRRPIVLKFASGGEYGELRRFEGPGREAARQALGRIDRCVCISSQIRGEARALGLERLVSIRNGVDLSRFGAHVEPAPDLGAGPVVLWVGRLSPEKRLLVLVEAFARVAAALPAARLLLAGEGPLRVAVEGKARALGIASHVTLLGSRTDVAPFYRAASVYVLPSVSEGISNTLLEALASGTPVVATAIPGNEDVVTHEREALLVPVDDPQALGAAILRVLGDSALATRLAAAGRERVAAEFDLEAVADRYVALFQELRPGRGRDALARSIGALALLLSILRVVAEGGFYFALAVFLRLVKGTFGVRGSLLR